MHVAHVITRLIVGGAQENTVASVLGLRARPGFVVDLISGPTAGAEGSLLSQLEAVGQPVGWVPDLVRPVRPLRDLRAFAQLTELFRKTAPDIVHTHSGKAGVLGRWAARRAGVPVIVHTIHGPSFGPFQGPLANLAFNAAERAAARCTDHFVSVCDAMTRQYLAAGIGQPGQFSRIWSGFALSEFLEARADAAWRTRLGLTETDLVIGTIARLAPLKGHADLVRLLPGLVRRHPRIKLLWVGDGPLRGCLVKQLERTGLESHVRFTGLVAPEEVARYVGVMDVLVHLSYREGLPRALPQALAAGRPVVAYDCDGAREVCLEGETGFLIPPGNVDLAGQRLSELAADPALRERFGRQGRALVRDRFTVERMVDDLAGLYARLWTNRGAGKARR